MLANIGKIIGNDFNPRTHEECDSRSTGQERAKLNFNPRTHEECDDFIE